MLLHSLFWVFLRSLNFMCRRFGTLCSILTGGLLIPPVKMEQRVLKRRHIKSRRRGITQNKECNIQITAKVGNQGKILL